MSRRSISALAILAALVPLGLAGCGGSGGTKTSASANSNSSSSSNSTSKSSSSSGSQLTFGSNGLPNLAGMKIPFGDAAGNAVIGDTNAYNVYLHLKQWGANATYTIASGATGELGVRSGSLAEINGGFSTDVDAGLTVFGPNQAHVDYLLLGGKGVTKLSQIKGQNVAVATTVSGDSLLMTAALKKEGLSSSQVKIVYTGSDSASEGQFISGRIPVTFLHASDLLKLKSAGVSYHILATAAQLIPGDADSFMAASPTWLKSHFADAEAIDLAWLASAKTFDTDPQAWVKVAGEYTKHAETSTYDMQAYQTLKPINGWPDNSSAFTQSAVNENLSISKSAGQIKGLGNRPTSQMADFGPWNAALKAFAAHPNL